MTPHDRGTAVLLNAVKKVPTWIVLSDDLRPTVARVLARHPDVGCISLGHGSLEAYVYNSLVNEARRRLSEVEAHVTDAVAKACKAVDRQPR